MCVNCFGLKPKANTIVEGLHSPLAAGDEYSSKASGVYRTRSQGNHPTRPSRKAVLSKQGLDLLQRIRSNPEDMLEQLEEERFQTFRRSEMPKCEVAYR